MKHKTFLHETIKSLPYKWNGNVIKRRVITSIARCECNIRKEYIALKMEIVRHAPCEIRKLLVAKQIIHLPHSRESLIFSSIANSTWRRHTSPFPPSHKSSLPLSRNHSRRDDGKFVPNSLSSPLFHLHPRSASSYFMPASRT